MLNQGVWGEAWGSAFLTSTADGVSLVEGPTWRSSVLENSAPGLLKLEARGPAQRWEAAEAEEA